ncbi:MAG: MFS transporter [Mycobacteriales bacterium]
MPGDERVSYRTVLANREFAALFVSQGLSTLGDQLARIAVAILVFTQTGSALAASATYAVAYLAYLLGGPVLSAISDRRPRVGVMVACDLARAPAILLLAIYQPPVWVYFLVLVLVGLLSPPFDSARSAIQPEIMAGEAYRVGNALMNVVLQAGQVLGFVLGGALVSLISARGALAIDSATFLVSAGLVLSGVRPRQAAQPEATRSSLLDDTRAGFRFVRQSPVLTRYLTLSVLTSAAVIGPEGLAVPMSASLGGGAIWAGLLTAAIPAGTVLGGLSALRLPQQRRLELLGRLALLTVVPLLATPLVNNLEVTFGLWFIAGLGNCLSLIVASAYMEACPPELRARAYGVAVTGLQVAQGVALLVSGALSDYLEPDGAVSLLAVCVLLALGATVLRPDQRAQGISSFGRNSQG